MTSHQTRDTTTNRPADLACLALLLALAAAFVWPALSGSRAFGPDPWPRPVAAAHQAPRGDFALRLYPWRMYLARSLRAGEAPLWNPHQFCGHPFAADDQSAVYYPPNLLFAALPAGRAFGAVAFLHLFLAGAFMFLFLRAVGAGRAGALAAGAGFMLSGWMVMWLAHAGKAAAAAWAPLVFLLFELALRRGGLRLAALCAAAFGMQLLAGFLPVGSFTYFGLLIYGAVRVATAPAERRIPLRRYVGVALCAGLGGTLLGAVHVLPVLELARSARLSAAAPALGVLFRGLAPQHAAALFVPDFSGAAAAHLNDSESFGYAGAAALCLALAALFSLKRHRDGVPRLALGSHRDSSAAALGAVALLGLLSAFGLPVHLMFYVLMPGARFLAASRIVFLFLFAVPALAGLGVDALARTRMPGVKAAAVLTAVGAGLVLARPLYGGAAVPRAGEFHFVVFVWGIALAGLAPARMKSAAGLVCAGLVAADLFLWGFPGNRHDGPARVLPEPPAVVFLKHLGARQPFRVIDLTPGADTLPPDTATAWDLDDFRGYDSLVPGRTREFMARVRALAPDAPWPPAATDLPASAWKWLDFMNVEYVIGAASRPAAARGPMVQVFAPEDGPAVYRNPRALPRAFVVRRWRVLDSDKAVLDALFSEDFDPAREAALTAAPSDLPGIPPGATAPAAAPIPAEILSRGPNSLVVRAQGPGLLVLSEAWAPGWTASQGEQPMRVLRANYMFRAVPLPTRGMHTITLRYIPASAVIGMYLSAAALALLIVMLVVSSGKHEADAGELQ